MTSSSLAQTLPFKTRYFFNIFIWVLARILLNPLIKPLEELSFICLLVKQGLCLIELVERLPTLAFMNKLPEEEKKSSPEQEEEVLIAKSEPLQSQDLAINPEPSIPQNPNPPK
jgi:hypothetical protein